MQHRHEIEPQVARLETLLEERLGVRRETLGQKAAQVSRDLPRAIRRDLATVAEASHLSGHPKLALRLDGEKVALACARAEAYLRGIDARYLRRGKLLGLLASLVVNLALAVILVLILLHWRGFI